MLNFNNALDITVDGKEAKKIEINNVVVWEKINIALTTSSNSVYWGQNVTLTATVSPAVEGLEVNFSNGVTATTDVEGMATTVVNMSTPQTVDFTANCSGSLSNSVNITWNKRNITAKMLSGKLYWGHNFRIQLTDSVSGAKLSGINCHFSVNTTASTPTKDVTSDTNGYCQWTSVSMGSKTSTSAVTWNWTVDLTGNTLYNGATGLKFSHAYQSSIKYNASLSSAATDSLCKATFSGSKVYAKWYPTSDDYTLVEALKGTGTVRSYLARSGSDTASCHIPEELYVRTNGKNGTSSVSGTILAIGYYITGRRNSTVTVKFKSIQIQLYSSSAWSTKETLSRTTTLPYNSDSSYGEYTGTFSYVPPMSSISNIRLVANFQTNTQNDAGYIYVSEFYPQIWYSPTQTFTS